MSRHQANIPTNHPPEILSQRIGAYLTHHGFKLIDPANGVWRKGSGWLVAPQFIIAIARPGELHIEAWIKFALFPGVFIGEYGITGAFLFIPKSMLKSRVTEIEAMAR